MTVHNNYELERRTREMRALTEVAKTLSLLLDLTDLLNAVLGKLAEILPPAETGVVMLWDVSSGVFRPAGAIGYNLAEMTEMGLRAGEGMTGKVYDEGRPRLLNDPDEIARAMSDLRPTNRQIMIRALGTSALPHSVIATPLTSGERRQGVLLLQTIHRPVQFSEDDLPFVQTMAELVALAIDRARLEKETELARDAREFDRLRAEVMATLSHELRTPLAAIKGYSTALLMEDVNWTGDKRQEFLSLIDAECEDLQTMISDILDSALIDVGHMAIEPQPVRLPRIADEVANEMQRRSLKHRIVVEFPREFPILDADPRRIKQVMRNLLDNALKYSPDGGLVVIRGQVRPNDMVISVADQGVGISPEDLIPLFEKYFRVKSPTGYHVAGTGLGLPVARAIVEAHGGRIWAESQVGQGTTLYFSLPRAGLSAHTNED